jgi:hypothetical protein
VGDDLTETAIFERITNIRAELLDVIGDVSASPGAPEPGTTAVQDDLIMVANRLGRVAAQLRPGRRPPDLGDAAA